jgi:ribosome maturation factor RimP
VLFPHAFWAALPVMWMWGSSPTFFLPAMPLDTLLDQIRELVDGLGFELVDLRRTGTRERPILQVRIDRADSEPGHGVTADDCATVSQALERSLESAGRVGPRYVLEVSSPGIERPLVTAAHWRRFVGRRARVRAAGLAGTSEVEILAVPDDNRVQVRFLEGARAGEREGEIRLADVRDAVLAVDWKTLGRSS